MVPRYGKRNIKLSLFSADRLIYRENLKKKKKIWKKLHKLQELIRNYSKVAEQKSLAFYIHIMNK